MEPETRAEIARRRLAQLVASFDEGATAEEPRPGEPAHAAPRRRVERSHVRVLGAAGTAVGVLLTWWLLASRPESSAVDTAAAAVAPAPVPTATAGLLVIDVVGRVKRPGIVELPPGSRVADAIDAAGGIAGKVDPATLNRARLLVDGEQLLVGLEPAIPQAPGGAPGPGGKLSLNTATLDQLDELPGVGPVTAQAILDWRTEHGRFARIDDLLDVTGIGDKTFADLRDLVTP